ncbi:tetratricopeptide repeat protein [Acidipila rosea]|uniref:Tetratricopeptide repeat protein n=1 Tax=Acidipila rosea TaxID=768535 RepID=A0A4R1L5V1_9BACT|nr:tetratricopeptide repeat protein [Acidipila rosea]TCK71649.1 tetratricopeptide repeat protein [Acidipila rosea]
MLCRTGNLLWVGIIAGLLGTGAALPAAAQMTAAAPRLQQADTAYRAGQAALAQRDLAGARADFEKVVKLAPQIEEGHSALGAILVSTGETRRGIVELEKALTQKPGDSVAQTNLALAYEQTGSYRKALPLFEKLDAEARSKAANSPTRTLSPYLLSAYARSLAATHQDRAAIMQMKRAAAAAPQNADLWDALGTLYAQQQEWPLAAAQFQHAIRLQNSLAVAHLHLGVVLGMQKELPQSIVELQRAIQLAPQEAAGYAELGNALVAAGHDADAIPVLQKALALNPSLPKTQYALAAALQRNGQEEAAIPLFKQLLKAEPDNAETLTNLGLALLQTNHAVDAIPLLQRAALTSPHDATAHQNLAAAYLQMNQMDDAARELRLCLKDNPDSPQMHYDLGLALKLKDDDADAIPEFKTAERLDPAASEYPFALGMLYLQDGRYQDAAGNLETALKLHPANADGWATLGTVYRNLNQPAKAIAALRQAIRLAPDEPAPHLTLATVLTEQGQTAEAIEQRKIGADLTRQGMNKQRAEIAINSGNALLQKGRVADALADFEQAIKDDPSSAAAHLGLATALERNGRTVEAAQERRKASSLNER